MSKTRGKGKSSNVTPVPGPTACIGPLKSNLWGITFQGMFDGGKDAFIALEGGDTACQMRQRKLFLLCIALYGCFCSSGGVVGETGGGDVSICYYFNDT